MADNAEDQMKQLVERLMAALPADKLDKMGKSIDTSYRNLNELAKASKKDTEASEKLSESFKKVTDDIVKSGKTQAQQSKELENAIKETTKGIKDADLKKSLEDQAKASFAASKAESARTEEIKKSEEWQKRWTGGLKESAKAFEPLGKAIGTVISGYQSQSQTGLAASSLTATMQVASDGAKTAGSSLLQHGLSARDASGKITGLGKISAVAGGALSIFGKATEIAAKAIPFLSGELDKAISGFQSLSTSGALFANGITGMKDAGKAAGLDLQQFSNVMKQNSSVIAESGMGVSEGARKIGAAFEADKKTGGKVRDQLTRLGFTYEEQAGLVAETMSTMKRTGQSMQSDPGQIAAQTAKYAENLRVIAAITGEDAKKKQSQVAEENKKLIVAQKLNSLDETTKANVVAAQQNMSDVQRKAFNEMMTFGRVVTPELAATMNQMPELQGSVNEAFQAFQSGQLDDKKMRDINAQRGDAIAKEINANQAIGMANYVGASQLTGAIGDSMASELEFRRKNTKEAIAAAEEAAKNQKEKPKTGPDLTGSMVDVIKANQDAKLAIQDAVLTPNVLGKFADAVKSSTEALTSMVKQFGGEGGGIMGGLKDLLTNPVALLGAAGSAASIYDAFKKPGGGPGGGAGGGAPKSGGGGGGRLKTLLETAKAGIGTVAQAGANMFSKGAEVAKATAAGVAGAAAAGGAGLASAGAGIAGAAGAAGSSVAAAGAGLAGAGSAAGAGASTAAKGLTGAGAAVGKSLLKKIPLIGLGIGLWDAAGRVAKGDYAGAAMSAASGVASTLPGAGTLVSTAIDAAQMGTDAAGLTGQETPVPATPSDQGSGTPTSNLNTQTQQFAAMTEAARAEAIKQAAGIQETDRDKLMATALTSKKEEDKASMDDVATLLMVISRTMEDQLDLMRNISNNTRNTVSAVS